MRAVLTTLLGLGTVILIVCFMVPALWLVAIVVSLYLCYMFGCWLLEFYRELLTEFDDHEGDEWKARR